MRVGSYDLVQLLGEGAFGRTYLARHALLGTTACVKQEKTQQRPYTDLFREEAELVAKLRHPSLPSFIDYLEMPGDVGQILILSFIEGRSLEDVLREGAVDDEHICWVLDRLLGALSYLHGRHRTVHCDLKPANVILEIADHQATIVDFGMAFSRPDGRSRAKGGTDGYMPPEFALGLPPVPASDLYAVGKIGVALAGGNVGSGGAPADMAPPLREFLASLTRHDPVRRPRDANALRAELEALRKKVWGRTSTQEEWKWRSVR